jgi:hypothetical protein
VIPSAAAAEASAPATDVYGVFSRSYETDNVRLNMIRFGLGPFNAFHSHVYSNLVFFEN